MNYDEFAFLNQQLAGMLSNGISLEGGLRQLCGEMQRGRWRVEFQHLESDLAKGIPLREALASRKLPELYVQMLQIGVQGGDLSAMLILLADYYRHVNALWTRLKGMMVYPLIVLAGSLALSVFFAFTYASLGNLGMKEMVEQSSGRALPAFTVLVSTPSFYTVSLFVPPIALGLAFGVTLGALVIPQSRRSLQWRLPGFKETSLSQFASAMGLMLRGGCSLTDSIRLIVNLEKGTPLGREMGRWHDRLSNGSGKIADLVKNSSALPPLFLWLLINAGEDLANGFSRAAEIYAARASHRIEIFLYAFLPVAVMVLGCVIITQAYGFFGLVLGWGLTVADMFGGF